MSRETPIRGCLAGLLALLPLLLWGQGPGNCLDFDGNDDHVTVNDPQPYAESNEPFTVECWVRSTDGSSNNNAFVTNYGGTGQTPFFMLGFDNNQVYFWIRDNSNTSSKPQVNKGSVMDGEWHHLAGVRADDGTYLYVDGKRVASSSSLMSDVSYGSELSLMDHFDRFTNGRLDEVRVWSKALSISEIRDLMCQGLTGSEADLYGYWPMDGASTGAGGVPDATGSGLDGTMQNMASSDVVYSGAAIGDTSHWMYPGSWGDRALEFDGSDDRVEVPDDPSLDIEDELTLSFWFKLNGSSGDNNWPRPLSKGQTTPSDGAYGVFVRDVSDPTDIGLRFVDQSGNTHDVRSSSVPNYDDGDWHHVAAVYSNSQDVGRLYVDGVLETSVSISGNVQIRTTNDKVYLGGALGSAQRHFNGSLDELRIWSRALDQNEIQNKMCTPLSSSQPGLEGYWDLNSPSGSSVPDQSGNGNDGSMVNMTPSSDRVSSNLVCSWSGLALFMRSYELDSLRVDQMSGSPDGVHIYHVESVPNSTTGISGLGGNDHYYGVFLAGGSNPTYDATYFYRQNDAYQNSTNLDESAMALFYRGDNTVGSWTDAAAALDQSAKTLEATSMSTEYILGNNSEPLPIELLSFQGRRKGEDVLLEWRTASERDNDHYRVLRSAGGDRWTPVGRVEGNGDKVTSSRYRLLDRDPLSGVSYYKLLQVDRDGDSAAYGPVAVRFKGGTKGLRVGPNPAEERFRIRGDPGREGMLAVELYGANGRLAREWSVPSGSLKGRSFEVGDLSAGVHFLRVLDGGGNAMLSEKISISE